MGSKAYFRQIIGQPAAVSAALERTDAPELDPHLPIVFTGVGSSLHACQTAAAWVVEITEGRVRPAVVDALELVLAGGARAGEQLIVVSHRGDKRFTHELIVAASRAGASTVLVTGEKVDEPLGDTVLRTCQDDAASVRTPSATPRRWLCSVSS